MANLIDATFPGRPWDGRQSLPLACGEGTDYPVLGDPDIEKRALERRFCDPASASCSSRRSRRRRSDARSPAAVSTGHLASRAPTAAAPIRGSCLCGRVRYEITLPFRRANYCHCSRCRKHSGAAALTQGRVPRSGFQLLSGAELLRTYMPEGGKAKTFCVTCGSTCSEGPGPTGRRCLFAWNIGDDPGMRPQYHAFCARRATVGSDSRRRPVRHSRAGTEPVTPDPGCVDAGHEHRHARSVCVTLACVTIRL